MRSATLVWKDGASATGLPPLRYPVTLANLDESETRGRPILFAPGSNGVNGVS